MVHEARSCMLKSWHQGKSDAPHTHAPTGASDGAALPARKRTYSRGWLCLPDDIETDLYQGWLCLPDDLETDLRKGWLCLPDDLETDLFEGWLCLPDDFETDLCQGWLCLPDDLETDLRKGWLSLPDDLDKTIRNIMEQALRKQNMHAQPEHCTTRTSSSTALIYRARHNQ